MLDAASDVDWSKLSENSTKTRWKFKIRPLDKSLYICKLLQLRTTLGNTKLEHDNLSTIFSARKSFVYFEFLSAFQRIFSKSLIQARSSVIISDLSRILFVLLNKNKCFYISDHLVINDVVCVLSGELWVLNISYV